MERFVVVAEHHNVGESLARAGPCPLLGERAVPAHWPGSTLELGLEKQEAALKSLHVVDAHNGTAMREVFEVAEAGSTELEAIEVDVRRAGVEGDAAGQ